MRKVIYQRHKMTDQKSGFFHCWSGTMQDAYALIEDTNTGAILRVEQSEFRFVQPPETRTHKNEKLFGEERFDREEIGKELDIAVAKLESLVLAPETEQLILLGVVLKNIRRHI